ncbi:MAG: zinc metallopeptidase [Candidatus Hydrogenedentes bacterium]|nr:zinc metallopeptidase [Candidatus Hydrogenedentota bacterium]
MFLDSTLILLIPAILLSLYAQFKVKSTYKKFSQTGTRSGLTGAEVAARILRDAGIALSNTPEAVAGPACAIEPIAGQMTDHYDPRSRVLRLSEGVYGARSISALGIAAHEVGHAIQHANSYAPLELRSLVYPATRIGSTLSMPLFLIGLFAWPPLLYAGIALFSFAVLFTLITLPVEFNASKRALKALADGGYLTADEMKGARKVLSAAVTYVAAAAMALLQLVRWILIAQRR